MLAVHHRPVVEPLEPKLLFSADLAPLLAQPDTTSLAGPALTQPVLTQPALTQQAATQTSAATHEIVFIDASVADLDTLTQDVANQAAAGRDIEAIVIARDEDGLARITQTLADRHDVAAIHLVSHGDDGQVQLGRTVLDAQTLLQRASDVAQWGNALTADGDLLIYGCDVARSAQGQALVRDLAALTGADVAASDDSTGQQALGGDWALEFSTGVIGEGAALSTQAQAGWAHTLALVLLPPSITSNGGGSTATTSVNENTTYVTTVTATAVDSATDSLTYLITGGTDAARFSIDASTGELRFRHAPSFEAPSDANGDNAYLVTVGVSNGVYTTTQALTVNVQDVNEAPRIVSNGGDGYAIIQVPTGTTAITQVQAVDPEGKQVIYTISSAQDGALMTIHPSTGVLSFNAPVDIANDRSSAGNNVYRVFAYAKDPGGNYGLQWIFIQIVDPAPVNQSPVIDSDGGTDSASVSVVEGQTAVTTVHATDADSGTLTYSLIGGDDQALFDIDASTGAVTFKAAPDATAPADADQDNVYEVIVGASDGNTSDSQALLIEVLAKNRAPVNTLPSRFDAQEDTALVLSGLSVHDVDAGSGQITVSLQVQHGVLTVRDDVGGGLSSSQIQYGGAGRQVLLTGTQAQINATLAASDGLSYLADANFNGTDTLTMVSDDQGHSGLDGSGTQASPALQDSDASTIHVAAVDDAPTLTLNTLDIAQGGTATPLIQISDVDSADGALSVRVQSVSGGHFIDTDTQATVTQFSLGDLQAGRIVFVHDGAAQAPAYTLVAQDGSTDSAASVAAISFDASPVISSDGGGASVVLNVPEFSTQVTTVQAQDADSGVLTYAIAGGADQALFTIDATTGVLRFSATPDITTAPFNGHGLDYTVIVAASDGRSQARQTLNIHLDTVNRPPVNTLPGGIAAQEDTPQALTGLAVNDPDAGSAAITVSLQVLHGTLAVRDDAAGGLSSGQIQYTNGQRQVLLTGTLAQINATLAASQGVQYLADANVNGSDTLTMVSNDLGHAGLGSGGQPTGTPMSDTDQVGITVAAINDAPIITLNQLTIDQGGRAAPIVQVSDVDSPSSAITLSAQNLRGGRFIDTASGATVSQFTLADVQAGHIVFVQDGSAQAPAYTLSASDGLASTDSSAVVDFTPTPPPPPADPVTGGPASNTGNDSSGASSSASATAATQATAQVAQAGAVALSSAQAMPLPAAPVEPMAPPPQALDFATDVPVPVKVVIDAPERPNIGSQPAPAADLEGFQYSWNASLSAPGAVEDLRRNLDALQEQLQGSGIERRHVVASSIALSTGMSVGYVIWLIRGGALVGSMLSAMPAWQMIDPLPVLHRGGGRGRAIELADGDASVEHLFDGDAPPPPPPPPSPPPAPTPSSHGEPAP